MTETWHTYAAQKSDHYAFITFEYGFSEIADTDSRKFLLKTIATIKAPTEAGFARNEEFSALADLEEALDVAITDKGGIYVGHVTAKGFRHFFFYVDFDAQTAGGIVAAASENLGYALALDYVDDPSRDGYWKDLYPSSDDWQVIRDTCVLDALRGHGDIAHIERKIQHSAIFFDVATATDFADWLNESSYAVSEIVHDHQGKCKVKFSHVGPMTPASITGHTIRLNRKANAIGGEYDGWQTSIERGM